MVVQLIDHRRNYIECPSVDGHRAITVNLGLNEIDLGDRG